MVVYLITNLVNGKQYVGKTVASAESRWSDHVSDAKHGRAHILHNAIRKYGREAFSLVVLNTCLDNRALCSVEKFWIKERNTMLPNGYNMTEGGEGALGYKHTDEAKVKMVKAFTGRVASKETRELLSRMRKGKKQLGKKMPEGFGEKISKILKGRVFTPEWKARISASKRGKKKDLFTGKFL